MCVFFFFHKRVWCVMNAFSAGSSFSIGTSIFLASDETTYAWGLSLDDQPLAEPTPLILPGGHKIVQATSGLQLSLLLAADGRVFSCGISSDDVLGRTTQPRTGYKAGNYHQPGEVWDTFLSKIFLNFLKVYCSPDGLPPLFSILAPSLPSPFPPLPSHHDEPPLPSTHY
jgi:hypothetical protein